MSITTHGRASSSIVFSSLVLLISLGLGACGEGVTNSNPGTLTLDLTKTLPQPDSQGVSITAPLRFAVMEDLEPTSVNSGTVHLMPGTAHNMNDDDGAEEDSMMLNTDPISGIVNYDPLTKTITFTPNVAMDQGRMYHIHASNILLKGNKPLPVGLDTIQYSFTTAHAHEFYRKEFQDDGVTLKEERFTETYNNMRVMRTEYDYDASGLNKTLDYKRHYGGSGLATHSLQGLLPTDILSYWQEGNGGGIERYEVKRKGSDGTEYLVRVRFSADNDNLLPRQASISDPIRNIWTADEKHGTMHQISYQYEPINRDIPTPWPSNNNPKTATDTFQLDDAQIMEMDHSKPASGTTSQNAQFQHRHIFLGDLGPDGKIDFNAQGNPSPVNDRVAVYHTRDLVNYLRTYDWSWYGKTRSGIEKYGLDQQLFTVDDLAYRVRVYIYDSYGRRVQRVTYEVPGPENRGDPDPRDQAPYGYTRNQWEQIIRQSGYTTHQLPLGQVVTPTQPAFVPVENINPPGSVPVRIHSYRIYEYNPVTTDTLTGQQTAGSLRKVTVFHVNDAGRLSKEQERYYTTQPIVTGEQLPTQF